jgi:hypothetical protein
MVYAIAKFASRPHVHKPLYKAGDCYKHKNESEFGKDGSIHMILKVGNAEYLYDTYDEEDNLFLFNPKYPNHDRFDFFEMVNAVQVDCPDAPTHILKY